MCLVQIIHQRFLLLFDQESLRLCKVKDGSALPSGTGQQVCSMLWNWTVSMHCSMVCMVWNGAADKQMCNFPLHADQAAVNAFILRTGYLHSFKCCIVMISIFSVRSYFCYEAPPKQCRPNVSRRTCCHDLIKNQELDPPEHFWVYPPLS